MQPWAKGQWARRVANVSGVCLTDAQAYAPLPPSEGVRTPQACRRCERLLEGMSLPAREQAEAAARRGEAKRARGSLADGPIVKRDFEEAHRVPSARGRGRACAARQGLGREQSKVMRPISGLRARSLRARKRFHRVPRILLFLHTSSAARGGERGIEDMSALTGMAKMMVLAAYLSEESRRGLAWRP